MTTIAVRAGVMACDSRADGEYAMTVDKIVRLPDGGVAGGAGNASALSVALDWLQGGEQGDPPAIDDECFILILRPDGSIWKAECRFPAFRLLDKFAATGSGSQFAIAAMAMGASAEQAVRIAAKFDTGTGGPVRTLAIEKAARGRRE